VTLGVWTTPRLDERDMPLPLVHRRHQDCQCSRD
jgi:hypothetical protein